METRRRFRCGSSEICIDPKLLCDGVSDCQPFNDDDETLCPWQIEQLNSTRTRRFICQDGKELLSTRRCNGKPDCKNSEDELFCDVIDPPMYDLTVGSKPLLENMDIYPAPTKTIMASKRILMKPYTGNVASRFVHLLSMEFYKR